LRAKCFYQDAIDEFTKAVHIQEPLLGENAPDVAKTHFGLGLGYRGVREFKQALYHLTKAAAIFEKQPLEGNLLDNPPKVVVSKFNHPYKKEIKECKLNLARTHHSYGVSLQRSGEYDQSILEHRKSLAIREHILGKTHLETARSYYVIGCALSDRGDFDEALAELRRALRTRLLIFGKDRTYIQNDRYECGAPCRFFFNISSHTSPIPAADITPHAQTLL
jgi:tetratricopeptide (TPR) repeat protein